MWCYICGAWADKGEKLIGGRTPVPPAPPSPPPFLHDITLQHVLALGGALRAEVRQVPVAVRGDRVRWEAEARAQRWLRGGKELPAAPALAGELPAEDDTFLADIFTRVVRDGLHKGLVLPVAGPQNILEAIYVCWFITKSSPSFTLASATFT